MNTLSAIRSAVTRARVWGLKGVIDHLFRVTRERRIRRILVANARLFPGDPTERGITLIAPLSGNFSLGKTVRDFARALKNAHIPFQTFDTFTGSSCTAKSDYADLLTPQDEFRLNRYTHIVEMFKSPLPEDLLPWAQGNRRGRIAFWEGVSGMLEVFPYLANGNAVLAMSDFNEVHFREELKECSPVHKILYPLLKTGQQVPSRSEMRTRYGIGQDDFVVFYNFDLGSYFRKNADGALRAFAEAFGGTPSARLVFKINGCKGHPDKLAALKALAHDLGLDGRFTTVETYIPQEDLFGLTAAADVYLSLHRAEGFGLGISEAMSIGIPVVVTDYSAPTEFCHPENAMLVPCKMVPVNEQEYFANMGTWADPDEHAAAQALRQLFDDPELRRRIGAAGKAFIESHYTTAAFKASVDAYLCAPQ